MMSRQLLFLIKFKQNKGSPTIEVNNVQSSLRLQSGGIFVLEICDFE